MDGLGGVGVILIVLSISNFNILRQYNLVLLNLNSAPVSAKVDITFTETDLQASDFILADNSVLSYNQKVSFSDTLTYRWRSCSSKQGSFMSL